MIITLWYFPCPVVREFITACWNDLIIIPLYSNNSFANCNQSPLQPLTQLPSWASCINCILALTSLSFLSAFHLPSHIYNFCNDLQPAIDDKLGNIILPFIFLVFCKNQKFLSTESPFPLLFLICKKKLWDACIFASFTIVFILIATFAFEYVTCVINRSSLCSQTLLFRCHSRGGFCSVCKIRVLFCSIFPSTIIIIMDCRKVN